MSNLINPQDVAPPPDFALKDTEGKEFRLSDFNGKSPVVLVFNRGFG
jgi:peroxiredoxin